MARRGKRGGFSAVLFFAAGDPGESCGRSMGRPGRKTKSSSHGWRQAGLGQVRQAVMPTMARNAARSQENSCSPLNSDPVLPIDS